jgi:hypothetical protein
MRWATLRARTGQRVGVRWRSCWVSSSGARESTLPRQRIWRRGAGRNSPASANADDPERSRGCYQARVATTWLPNLILAPLIAFGLYRRFKRSFGRQKLVLHRMVLRMVVLSVVSALFLCWLPTAAGFAAAAAGLVVGVSLAFIDLSHTEVVRTDAGSFFTPNRWIGLVVTSLFVARLTVRLFAVYQHSAEVGQGVPSPPSLQRSPLTLALYFLLAGYYVSYYAGVLKKERGARSELSAGPRVGGP